MVTDDSEQRRIFAVGDIHGCYDKLVTLLSRLPYEPERDTLVFLGDYINRGSDSKRVIDHLLTLREAAGRTIFLKGNHEQLLMEYGAIGDTETLRVLRKIGVEATTASYGCSMRQLRSLDGLPADHRSFLETLDFSYRDGDYLFIHADCSPDMVGVAQSCSDPSDPRYAHEAALLASRRLAAEDERVPGCIAVFGHVPFSTPFVTRHRIGIDTGAVYGNLLTAVELPGLRFFHS